MSAGNGRFPGRRVGARGDVWLDAPPEKKKKVKKKERERGEKMEGTLMNYYAMCGLTVSRSGWRTILGADAYITDP